MDTIVAKVRAFPWLRRHRPGNEGQAQLAITAFGKHPAWPDHIHDIDLPTPNLVAAQSLLYETGFVANISAGTWSRLSEDRRLEAFRQEFVWQFQGSHIVGRLWPSADARGRSSYPMVICAEANNLSPKAAEALAMPILVRLDEQCRNATSASAVHDAVTQARAAAKDAVAAYHDGAETEPFLCGDLAGLADRPELGQDGFVRVLYHLSAYLDLAMSNPSGHSRVEFPPATHIRIPLGTAAPADLPRQWTRFLAAAFGTWADVLTLIPTEQPWFDLILGSPGADQFYCIRTTTNGLPATSEIPFTIDEPFLERWGSVLERCRENPDAPFALPEGGRRKPKREPKSTLG